MTARVDPVVAREVATAYLDADDRPDPITRAAFARLAAETDVLFARITSPARRGPVRVAFTSCLEPYLGAAEMIASVEQERTLEVTTVAVDRDRRHPLLDNERGAAYDRLRAVHDVLGHARPGVGFDRDGEYAAWLVQERFHSPLARRALATELHGQHSVRWTTGEIAPPRAMLLDERLLRRARNEEATP